MRPQVGHLNSYSGTRYPVLASPVRLACLTVLGAAAVAALSAGRCIRHDVALALVAVQDASAGSALAKPTDISRLAEMLDHFFARRAARFTGSGLLPNNTVIFLKSGSHFSA